MTTTDRIVHPETGAPFTRVRDLIEVFPAIWLALLQEVYRIDVARDGDLVSLKYNMLESPMADPIVQECRGMVVDTVTNQILAHPYNKFWNYGEPQAAAIDWATAQVQEKLDGSLMLLYFDPRLIGPGSSRGGWRVASSGHPTAGGRYGADETRTFHHAFWETFRASGMRLPPVERGWITDTGYAELDMWCYMFELCSPDPGVRIVVRHDRPRLVFHGARNLNCGYESPIGVTADGTWETVKTYPITSIAECLAAAEALDPIQHEGFVVVDRQFNRVKIKSPRYVILHHLKGEATPRGAVRLWQTGETGELLTAFPEFADQVTAVHDRLDRATTCAYLDYRAFRDLPTQKEFAQSVKGKPWSGITFLLRKDPSPSPARAKAIARGLSLAALERMLEAIP